MFIRDLLEAAGRPVVTISHDATVKEAIAGMAEKNTSSLIVNRGDTPAGIFTEHDIIRAFSLADGPEFVSLPVSRAMTNKLITVTPEDGLDSSISLMLGADIRHLPVMEAGKVTTILHLCDLVQYKLEILASEMEHLEHYVKDLHGAMTD